MARRQRDPGFVVPPDAPVVPPGLVPAVERPARGVPANPWAAAAVGMAGLLAFAALGAGLWFLLLAPDATPAPVARAGRAEVAVAIKGVGAWVRQDLGALAPLIPPATVRTPAFRQARGSLQLAVGTVPGAAHWRGDTATMTVTFGTEVMTASFAPAIDASGGVLVRWTGKGYQGQAWRVLLRREGDKVLLVGISLGPGRMISFEPEHADAIFGLPTG